MFRRRPSALMLSGLAIVAAVGAVVAVAAVSGVSLNRVFEHFRPVWIAVVAVAEAVSFLPYMIAYRQMTVVAGLNPPSFAGHHHRGPVGLRAVRRRRRLPA